MYKLLKALVIYPRQSKLRKRIQWTLLQNQILTIWLVIEFKATDWTEKKWKFANSTEITNHSPFFSLFLVLSLCSQRLNIRMIYNKLRRWGYLKVENLKKWKTNKCPFSFANNLWPTLKQLEWVMGPRAKDLKVGMG